MSARGKFQTVGLLGPLELLVIAILLSGCATTVPLKPTVDHLPSVSKIPLSVGIYYSPELRSYKYEVAQPGNSCLGTPVLVGQLSVSLFERLFLMMFHSTVTLESRQTLLSTKANLSLVIEPDIEDIKCDAFPKSYTVKITYHFTLYSPNGELLAHWNVTGWGHPKRGFDSRKTAELAMQDAADRIAIQFREIPAVKRLLQEKR